MQLLINEPHQLELFEPNQVSIDWPRPKSITELTGLILADGRRPRPFQAENISFLTNKAGFRGLIADDTGLGKTISTCATIYENKETLLPVLIVCKTTLKIQWFIELLSTTNIIAQVISSGDDWINENADAWIVSYDLAKKYVDNESLQPKTIVLDEAQLIKNWEAARTEAIVKLSYRIPYIIGTTATPIKNNFYEYYPILHMIQPKRFNDRAMIDRMCDLKYHEGKWRRAGIAPYYEKAFRELTDDMVIRHKREDVAPELPTVLRNIRYVEVEDTKAKEALADELKNFVEAYDAYEDYDAEKASESRADLKRKANSSLMRLRHITGDVKVPYILDYIEEFLNESPDRKLTIFVHHKSVADAVLAGITELRSKGAITCNEPYIIRGGMNEEVRNDLVAKCTMNQGWPTNDILDRLLVASTLAAGEGINLQKCRDFLMAERQFNPPNEEQAEGRFSRIGIDESVKNIFGVYMIMKNTVDDWFHKLVEFKRDGLKRTYGDKEEYGGQWGDEDEIVTDFMAVVAEQGRRFIKSVEKKVYKKKEKS